jgi:hypothetical protein
MKMRNLSLSKNHNQNKPEEELHSKDQGVKHLKEEGQETENQCCRSYYKCEEEHT